MNKADQSEPRRAPYSTSESAIRFILVGGSNTLITGIALSLLAHVITPWLAYTIVYILGLVYSVGMAGRFVFGVSPTRGILIKYALLYIGVFIVGLIAVRWASHAGLPGYVSGLVVFITAPLTFIGGRLLFVKRKPSKGEFEQ